MDYNTFKNRLTSIYERRKNLHLNDPQIYEYWEEITELMASDEEQTIRLLRDSSEDEVLWFTEVFDDIVARFKSENFAKVLEELSTKYPNLNLAQFIIDAKKYI
jgi:hypothetical protein